MWKSVLFGRLHHLGICAVWESVLFRSLHHLGVRVVWDLTLCGSLNFAEVCAQGVSAVRILVIVAHICGLHFTAHVVSMPGDASKTTLCLLYCIAKNSKCL